MWSTQTCTRTQKSLGFTRVGARTLRQSSQFKHIKSTVDYVCRYYPKNQPCAFSKETQTITDLITPELYHSCCRVFTLSDMAETTAPIRRRKILISTFPTCRLSQSREKISDEAWSRTRKPAWTRTTFTSNSSQWLPAFIGSCWDVL